MQTSQDSGFWSELNPEEGGGPLCDEQRAHLLDHLSWCAECREKAASAGSVATIVRKTPLSRARSLAIRDRLMERARSERPDRRPKSGPGAGLRASAGWLVAAGLASLLLTHHSFHRPLALGWVIAGVLGLICFGLILQASYLRSQLRRTRADGPPGGSDPLESFRDGSRS